MIIVFIINSSNIIITIISIITTNIIIFSSSLNLQVFQESLKSLKPVLEMGTYETLLYFITRRLLAVIITHMTQLDEITAVVDPTKLLLELISHFTSRLTLIDR